MATLLGNSLNLKVICQKDITVNQLKNLVIIKDFPFSFCPNANIALQYLLLHGHIKAMYSTLLNTVCRYGAARLLRVRS